MTNRLAKESSPYLQQHAHNPVDWYPWGDEAFERAKAEHKPVLLSVGYAACHWCHVMAHESFESEAIAQLMNQLFVCIKVDREERPDVDAVYMAAVQTLSGHGGWPLTVFLTPAGEPFYGGTYYPPTDHPQQPGFPRVLAGVAAAFNERHAEVATTTHALLQRLKQQQDVPRRPDWLDAHTLDQAIADYKAAYDPRHGGFGGAPKFPPAMALELLLRRAQNGKDDHALAMAEHTLEQMARGGLYDQLGGGFHRYSVDAHWGVPHFEKMLYDNALLARVYMLAFQATRKVLYEVVASETLDYVLRELTGPQGQFYGSQDADSEGVEGKFFVWSHAEILAALGPEDGPLFAAAFDVTPSGNFEGQNILHLPGPLGEVAAANHVSLERMLTAVARGREHLFELREQRVKPVRDEKAIASWNGLMLEAFALASAVFSDARYLEAARQNATFLLTHLTLDGRLLRTFTAGQAKQPAFLEDYACVTSGLLALYEATFEPRWLEAALDFSQRLLEEFWDAETATLYDTARGHDALFTRPRELFDNATPSGNGQAATVLLRLARLTGDAQLQARAEAILAAAGTVMRHYPLGAGRLLCALDFHLAPGHEVVLAGTGIADDLEGFRAALFYRYHPYVVLAGGGVSEREALALKLPLLAQRPAQDGHATAYACRQHTCQLPTQNPAELLGQLE